MVHLEVRRGYHEVAVSEPQGIKPEQDMFIGRFSSDKQYHVLGYRPTGRSDQFSAESESNGDFGVVGLPENKTTLGQLVSGDVFTVNPLEGDVEPYQVKFYRHK